MKLTSLVIGLILLTGMVMAAEPQPAAPVELTKSESLALMNLQFTVLAAEADLKDLYAKRTAMMNKLTEAYKVDPAKFELDIANGRFVPKKETNVQKDK